MHNSTTPLIESSQAHLDAPTSTPDSHPAGTGIGAVSGGLAGAAAGMAGGPIGMAVGATVGAFAGGIAGSVAAESMNPTTADAELPTDQVPAIPVDTAADDAHWRRQFRHEPYYLQAYTYEDYAPAYRTGMLGHGRLAGNPYAEIESQLERDYSANRGGSPLSWKEAAPATRAAWTRAEGAHSRAPD